MVRDPRPWALAVVLVAGGGPYVTVAPAQPGTPPARHGAAERGLASWYGVQHHGRRTASGEVFDMHSLTAAHRRLPLGTRVRVTNRANGRSIVVRVNDRGPFIAARIIDVSYAAASRLGAIRSGVFPATIEVVAGPVEIASEG